MINDDEFIHATTMITRTETEIENDKIMFWFLIISAILLIAVGIFFFFYLKVIMPYKTIICGTYLLLSIFSAFGALKKTQSKNKLQTTLNLLYHKYPDC